MIPQTKPHIDIISQFAELILHNRIASQNTNLKKPNHFNLSFQNSYHNIDQKLNDATTTKNKSRSVGLEICFFLQNQESKQNKQLVETWVINVQIPNKTIEVMTPRKQLFFDNQKSHKLCILQSRGIASFLINTPLFQRFMNIKAQNSQEDTLFQSQNTLLHQLRICQPELELNKNTTSIFTQHIFPPIPILCAAGLKGQLQIKVKYLNNIQSLKFAQQNFIPDQLDTYIRTTQTSHQRITSIPEVNQQYALTQESSNHTNNSGDKNEFSDLKKSWRKGSMQPENSAKQRQRTKSFSTQIAAYSRKEDVVLLMTAEDALEFDQKSDEELDFQMIQKYDQMLRINLNEEWLMLDRADNGQTSKSLFQNSDLWKLIQKKKDELLTHTKYQKKLLKSQLLITILFVKEE